jgi:hypothetical protein
MTDAPVTLSEHVASQQVFVPPEHARGVATLVRTGSAVWLRS